MHHDSDDAVDSITDLTYISQRRCKSTTSLHSFKSAFGTSPLTPGRRYYFEIKLVKGSNFKIGIALSEARAEPDIAFSDTELGWAYYSNGQTRHNSKGTGDHYGETFKGKDIIGVYADLVQGCLFFAKNGRLYGDAFKSKKFTEEGNVFYPACSCLTKEESFEVMYPRHED